MILPVAPSTLANLLVGFVFSIVSLLTILSLDPLIGVINVHVSELPLFIGFVGLGRRVVVSTGVSES